MKILPIFMAAVLLCAAGCSGDPKHPDTRHNREMFEHLTRTKLSSGIKEIYGFSHDFDIAPFYCLGFSATPEAVVRIVKNLGLKKQPESSSDTCIDRQMRNIPWWDKEERGRSELYSVNDTKMEMVFSLWHDPKTGKCQFLAFGY